MTDRELMQLALNTLDLVTDLTSYDNEVYEAIDALHARLAQPEQEPVEKEAIGEWIEVQPGAILDCTCHACTEQVRVRLGRHTLPYRITTMILCPDCGNKRCPKANDHRNECTGSNELGQAGSAYADIPPPQREWKNLLEEDIDEVVNQTKGFGMNSHTFARAIEAKLKERNANE